MLLGNLKIPLCQC